MISPILQEQFDELKLSHEGARLEQHPNGTGTIITVPNVKLEPKDKWNRAQTTVRILAPLGYPQAKPDCFWVDSDVRLTSGALPSNAQVNNQLGPDFLWFSWHVGRWNPNTDTLKTYLNVIRDRLRQGR